jgi:hypothetical protein
MAKGKTLSRPLKQEEGFTLIENYYHSGMSPRAYYTHQGMTESQFYSWRKRYLAIHPQEKTSGEGKEKKLHPVKIEAYPENIRVSGIEIHYPHGVWVVIGDDHPAGIEKIKELIQLRV